MAFDVNALLAGEHAGWDPGALVQVLRDAKYVMLGHEGAWSSWKHEDDARVVTIWTPPGRTVHRKYVEKVANHLREMRERKTGETRASP
jgi:hypothetical protein